MRRPDDNERSYQARSVNYNNNSYQGQVIGHNPNRVGIVFIYDEQGQVIELTSGQDTDPFSNQVHYNTNNYKYEYQPPITDQSLLINMMRVRNALI